MNSRYTESYVELRADAFSDYTLNTLYAHIVTLLRY